MIIGLLRTDILIPGCQSLKDKRSVVKKHLHRIRRTYNAAVAETDFTDKWRRAELSFVSINSKREVVEKTLGKILRELETGGDIQLLGQRIEIL